MQPHLFPEITSELFLSAEATATTLTPLQAVGNKKLPSGTVFTILRNTSATPISGTFANLSDGSTLTAGRNKLLVSYTGGDGDDLTLTVQ